MEPIWTVASELEQQSDPDSARSVSDVATAAARNDDNTNRSPLRRVTRLSESKLPH
jgi:hypothetical protein